MGFGPNVAKASRQLRGASLQCELFDAQYGKFAAFLMAANDYCDKIKAKPKVLHFLPD